MKGSQTPSVVLSSLIDLIYVNKDLNLPTPGGRSLIKGQTNLVIYFNLRKDWI